MSELDLGQLMRQAQEMQQRVQRIQEELRHREVEATVGGGMVTARVNGQLRVVAIRIDPQAVDPRDVDMLQDLIVAAVNEALSRAQALAQEEMQKLAGGLPLGNLGSLLGGTGPT